jgi:hypothetical protein
LLDFQELVGEHSGENLANVVWATMEHYGITDKVCNPLYLITEKAHGSQIIAIVSDNASNNDTMMAGIQRRCRLRNIAFDSKKARIRCIPHTIQRAALKVSSLCNAFATLTASQILEALGAVSEKEASIANTNYQDIVNAVVDAAVAATRGDSDNADAELDDTDIAVLHSVAAEMLGQKSAPLTPVATAIEKVLHLTSFVRIL